MMPKKTGRKTPSSATNVAAGYLHGYSHHEQARLVKQARFLEESVYEHVDFSQEQGILEVGCGVGAQTEILLERFPHLKIQGVDASPAQISTAKKRLASAIRAGRVRFEIADALHLPYPESSFEGAFVCWFLEHVRDPIGILREIRRVMKPSSSIYCSEVLNATLYLNPYSPATHQYWFAYNDHQWSMQGDPFVGGKLANYLLAAGFQNISTEVKTYHYDNRAPKHRAECIDYWINMLLSGAPSLLKARKVTESLVNEMKRELTRLKDDPDAVFFYSWVQARAQAF